MLSDYAIRQRLLTKLHKENAGKSYRVIEELAICEGEARADIALANGVFHGYEIKSDLDTLERLANQKECYNLTFDKITIIVGVKYAEKILGNVPEFWGIEVAYLNKFGNVSIKKIRTSKMNYSVESIKLLDLLWNNELKILLKEHKMKGYSSMKREQLKINIIENIPYKTIKNYTRETLKTRTGWRADLPLM